MNSIGKEIHVIPLAWSDLASVPLEQKSLYVCLSFLVSELNCFQKLVLLATQRDFDDPAHLAIAAIQGNALIRTYSSKCFEAQVFVRSCYEKARDEGVKNLARKFVTILEGVNIGKGYAIAEHIRRKMAFHLDFRQASISTREAKGELDCNLYTADVDGNCFFPIGDQIVFHEGLIRASEEAKHSLRSDSDYSKWVEWALSVNSKIKDMHFETYKVFVRPTVFGKPKRPRKLSMKSEAIAVRGRDGLPLFIGDG